MVHSSPLVDLINQVAATKDLAPIVNLVATTEDLVLLVISIEDIVDAHTLSIYNPATIGDRVVMVVVANPTFLPSSSCDHDHRSYSTSQFGGHHPTDHCQ